MSRPSESSAKLKMLRVRAGLSVGDMAAALGRPKSSYQYYEDEFKKPFFDFPLVKLFADVLVPRGVAEDDVMELAGILKSRPSTARTPDIADSSLPPGAIPVPAVALQPAPIDVPVYGVAAGNGSGDGSFRLEEHAVDYVRRPPGIAHAKDVYAVYVTGESMYPVYRHGTLLFIAPGRPISIGDDVLVCLHPKEQGEPDEYLIKRLVRRTAAGVTVEQFTPPLQLDFPADRVKHLHKVLEARELVGI